MCIFYSLCFTLILNTFPSSVSILSWMGEWLPSAVPKLHAARMELAGTALILCLLHQDIIYLPNSAWVWVTFNHISKTRMQISYLSSVTSLSHFIMFCLHFMFLLSGLVFFFIICIIIQYLTSPVLKKIQCFIFEAAASIRFSKFCLA